MCLGVERILRGNEEYMGIMSDLKHLGLGSLEQVDIYEKDENVKQKEKKQSAPAPKPLEKDLIYDKAYECPVCGTNFTAKIMKSSKARLIGTDQDLRPRYDVIDAVKYDVVLCPVCGYAALNRFFTNVSPGQKKLVMEKICSSVRITEYHDEVYSYREAMERYQLALANAVVKRVKASEKAYICLKSAWLIRGCRENPTEEKRIESESGDLEKMEEEYLQHAFKGFLEARQSETFPMCGMNEVTLDYLMASLAMRFKKYDVAARMISAVLTSSSASSRVKDKVRDMKEQVLQELRKNKCTK